MAKKLSASELTERLTDGLVEKITQIQERAAAEVRQYLGERLAEMANGTAPSDKNLRECWDELNPGFVLSLTDDFRTGFAFAAQLVTDPDFEY